MKLNKIINELNPEEKNIYLTQSASNYFRLMHYSEKFIPILEKLETRKKLTIEEWDYLVKRLFLITCKAIAEEDNVTYVDMFHYTLSKIGQTFSIKDGHLYNECVKMIEFIDSISMEKDINNDLLCGLDIIKNSDNPTDLDILLKQHREAAIFRDNQDAYFDAYRDSYKGFITDSERAYINSMHRSYEREKNLVKEYEK